MIIQQFIDGLAGQGITLWKDGDSLRYKAPKGVMNAELLSQIKEKKDEIITVIGARGETVSLIVVPEPESLHEPFPLTDVQQAYWIGRSSSYNLGNIGCHIYFELENTELNIDRLNRAWQRVVKRHDMLRAIILPDGRQKILQEVPPYVFQVYDLRDRNPGEVEKILEETREEMSHQVMQAEVWPSFDIRVSLYSNRSRIHISLDYLFADASSHLLIFNEWYTFYSNPAVELPTLELSFRDYVIAQAKRKTSRQVKRAEEYWLSRLDAFPPAPPLPLAKNPSEVDKPRFKRRINRLDTNCWSAIKKRAAGAKLTPSGVLQAAFAQVLGAWSNTSRFAINMTLFNRENLHSQVPGLVGEFTSLILLEVDNSHEETFVQKARRVQQQLMDDLDHSSVSAVQVLRELARRRGNSENVTMPIVFTSTIGYGSDGPGDLEVFKLGDLVYSITQTPQIWLDHQVMEFEGGLLYNWDSVDELFPEGLIDDMFNAYSDFLQQLAFNDSLWSEVRHEFIPSAQLQKRIEVNQTQSPLSPKMLHTLFAEQVDIQPEKPAVITSRETLSYAELAKRSGNTAAVIHEKGVQRGALVAIVMEKGWEQIAAVLGILETGNAYLPIDPTLPEDRLKFLLKDGAVSLVLTQSWLSNRIAWPDGMTIVAVDKIDQTDKGLETIRIESDPDDIAYVIYTSGSTGFPKGVVINHRGAVNTILDVNERFNIGSGDRVLAISSLSFDLSVYDIFGTLAAGGAVVLPDADKRTDPQHWSELVEKQGVTIWNTVPALMQLYVDYLIEKDITSGGPLRLALMSGDWIPLDLPEKIRSRFEDIRIVSLGGATEASIWSILYPIDEVKSEWKSIPYGYPMLNQRFYVLNSFLEDCPDWVPGHLYIGGKGLAMGYWNDKVKTNSQFIIHPKTGERLYKTGDMGRFWPDGTIEFLGREDFQVKIRGYRIELGEIEATIKQFEGIIDSVVTVDAGSKGDKRLAAYVVGNKENPPVFERLQRFLEDKLPEYMVPKAYMYLDSLPLSSNGKVDRKALPKPGQVNESSTEYTEPRTPLEKRLAALWAEVLEKDRIGVNDDFFSIGGDSLIATRLVLKIRDALDVDLSLPRLFEAPTIAQLAELIKDATVIPSTTEQELLSSEDLQSEAFLDADINAEGVPLVEIEKPSKIFLTGASGFLGAYLLNGLLHTTDARIYCLIRGANVRDCKNRIQKNLDKYGLWDEAVQDRIIPVMGDLSEPSLGLSERDFNYLADTIEVIYHNGALAHFLYPYSIVKPANVLGTKEILRFACRCKVKHVHYVSTISIFSDHGIPGTRVIEENQNIDESGILDSGYAQSKWVAEKLVWKAFSRGIPVTVYRPGLVMGDSQKGTTNIDDFILRVFKASLEVQCAPKLNVHLNGLPVDYVSKAIVGLSLQKRPAGEAFHLVHPKPMHLDVLVNWIRAKGPVLRDVSYEEWVKILEENPRETALSPLLLMFPKTLDDEGHLIFSIENTLKRIKEISLEYPPIDDRLLSGYFEYLTGIGFITEAEIKGETA